MLKQGSESQESDTYTCSRRTLYAWRHFGSLKTWKYSHICAQNLKFKLKIILLAEEDTAWSMKNDMTWRLHTWTVQASRTTVSSIACTCILHSQLEILKELLTKLGVSERHPHLVILGLQSTQALTGCAKMTYHRWRKNPNTIWHKNVSKNW